MLQGMPEETCGELQPLLHSTSDTALRRRVIQTFDNRDLESVSIDMEAEADVVAECDTDSNKTEVEEIEMVEMESRDIAADNDDNEELTAARHRLETRQDYYGACDDDTAGQTDENGNPSTRHIHPIMTNNVRPVSIYRHTPVFRSQKLKVPHTVHNDTNSTSNTNSSYSSSISQDTSISDRNKSSTSDSKRKPRRKKEEEKNVIKAEDIEGYRGNKDLSSVLEFLGEVEGADDKKKTKKNNDKSSDKNSKKVLSKSDSSKDDQKVRKKKEKSQEKDSTRPQVTKKLSTDNEITDDVIEEQSEGEAEEDTGAAAARQSLSPDKVSYSIDIITVLQIF